MINIYDARTPAPGVRVCSVPRPKMHVTHTQAKNMRKLSNDYSVMTSKPLCQPVKTGGGGLPPSNVVAKGDTRSSNHRRRSPKMKPQNRCFGPQIPSMYQTLQMHAMQKIEEMRRIYRRIVRVANRDLDMAYGRLRDSFRRLHHEHMWMVIRMEVQVEGENHVTVC